MSHIPHCPSDKGSKGTVVNRTYNIGNYVDRTENFRIGYP